jgi:hypothetical protein
MVVILLFLEAYEIVDGVGEELLVVEAQVAVEMHQFVSAFADIGDDLAHRVGVSVQGELFEEFFVDRLEMIKFQLLQADEFMLLISFQIFFGFLPESVFDGFVFLIVDMLEDVLRVLRQHFHEDRGHFFSEAAADGVIDDVVGYSGFLNLLSQLRLDDA